jgi:hypothetical protein
MGSLVPGYQGTGALGPGPRSFFYFILFFILVGVLFFSQKVKKTLFSLCFFSLSLFLSFPVHTLRVLLSLIRLCFADAFVSSSKVCLSLVMCPGFLSGHTPLVTDKGEGVRQKILIRQVFDRCVTVWDRQEGLSSSHIFRTPGKTWRVFFEKDLFEKSKNSSKSLGKHQCDGRSQDRG